MKYLTPIPKIIILIIFITIPLFESKSQSGKTFVVNSLGDAEDTDAGEPGDNNLCSTGVTLPNGQKECTFRAAIQNHNANRNLDLNKILFNIDLNGAATTTIKPASPLPPVLGAVEIHGTNSTTSERVELDGSMAGSNVVGLRFLGGQCRISWLVIHSFSSHGIYVAGTPPPGEGGHFFEKLFIGVGLSGNTDKGNGGDGIFIDDTPDNIIGGLGFSRQNVISGNEGYGIRIVGKDPQNSGSSRSGAKNNKVEGNLIGLDWLGDAEIPNSLGGIYIQDAQDNTVGGTAENQKNEIVGKGNGITVEGSLSNGILIQGNYIGKDGTGAKFKAGILHKGKHITIEGNVFTNIDSVGIEAFFNFDGNYNIRKNQFTGTMKIGTKLDFGQNRNISIVYENNIHTDNNMGVLFKESLHSTINWTITGNDVRDGVSGGLFELKAAGNKNFTDNTWDAHADLGFKYLMDIDTDVQAAIIINGGVFSNNGSDGVAFRGSVRGEIIYRLSNMSSKSNGGHGTRLEFFADAGSDITLEGSNLDLSFSVGAGLRLVNEASTINILRGFVELSDMHDNVVGVDILGFKFGKSLTNNQINNNTEAGIRLGSNSKVRIAGNNITGNGTGILIQDASIGEISNNTISGNGLGVNLAGTGIGTSLAGNFIFDNTGLGIDLGNNGVSPNDMGDGDIGPNNLQNFPVLTSAKTNNNQLTLTGTINSTPNAWYRLEFFANTTCDGSGFGEGKTFLGFDSLKTDNNGNANFTIELDGVNAPLGSFITATATDSSANSSEFSQCLEVQAGDGEILEADLSLSKAVDKSSANIGEQFTFTLNLNNSGPDNTSEVEVKDLLPTGLNFVSTIASQGNYDNNTGIWEVGNLTNGTSVSLTIVAIANQVGLFTNTAEVTKSKLPDPDSTPNNNNLNEDDRDSVLIEVLALPPPDGIDSLIANLINDINKLVKNKQLKKGLGKSLISKLKNALKQFNKGRKKVAVALLSAFILEVKVISKSGKLSKKEAKALIKSAKFIIWEILAQEKMNQLTMEDANEQLNMEVQNFPNPFKKFTKIHFNIPEKEFVRIEIYNQANQKIETLVEAYLPEGKHQVHWETGNIYSGIYYCRLTTGRFTKVIRLVLTR